MKTLTMQMLDALASPITGQCNFKTLKCLGIPTPLRGGWMRRAMGTTISDDAYQAAVRESRAHAVKVEKRRRRNREPDLFTVANDGRAL